MTVVFRLSHSESVFILANLLLFMENTVQASIFRADLSPKHFTSHCLWDPPLECSSIKLKLKSLVLDFTTHAPKSGPPSDFLFSANISPFIQSPRFEVILALPRNPSLRLPN